MADITANINQSPAMRVAANRIEGFARQFEEPHRKLALHAAFPLVLTPDLLYQIWANFVPEAPWIAVAHVLLSRLCREVGYEMYEMDIAIRNLLLKELKEKYGQQQLNKLGDFLLYYVEQRLKSEDPHTQDLKRTQEWTALVYTKPGTATRELAEALSAKVKQEDMAEGFHLTSLIETWAEPLAEAGFQPLLVYADGIRSFFRGDQVSAINKLRELPGGWDNAQIAGVSLSIPEQIKAISPEPKPFLESFSPKSFNPKLYALLIGADYYLPNRLSDGSVYHSLNGCVNDIDLVEKFLHHQLGCWSECIFKLTSSNPDLGILELSEIRPQKEPQQQWPTYENIIKAFQDLEHIAQPGDQVYIHYSGHGARLKTIYPEIKGENGIDEALVPIDVGTGEGRYLRDLEFVTLFNKMVNKGLMVTMVLDCPHSGGIGQSINFARINIDRMWWYPKNDYVLLTACRPSELSYEYAFNRHERNGALTYWLVDSLCNMAPNITYKQLYNRILAKVQAQFPNQTPMLWGQGDRLVFGNEYLQTENAATIMQVKIEEEKTRVQLDVGQAQGLRKGAKFAIYPLGLSNLHKERGPLALAEIIKRDATDSWAEVKTILRSEPAIEQGAQAVLTSPSVNLVRKVRLLKDEDLSLERNTALQAVKVAIAGNGWVVLVEEEDVADYQVDVKKIESKAEAEKYQVAVNEVIYEICDRTGVPIVLRPGLKVGDSNSAEGVVKRLVHLAKYQAVLEIDNYDANSPLKGAVVVELLGKQKEDYDPVDGAAKPEPFTDPNHPEVKVGEYVFLKIRNDYSAVINVAVLDLQSDWAISQIYPETSQFVSLDPGQEESIPFRTILPKGEEEGEDILKVFATIDSANFRWLELPPLDQPIQYR
ncbi:MAG: caspase family protein [Xenococcaceae cyanobacterium MO_188.B29]|nr:caspase family protein [Xenococcaceae cyanobacterium MO_188.B29]